MTPDDPLFELLGGIPAFGEPALRLPRARGALAAQQREPVSLPQSAARYRADAAALQEQAAARQAAPIDLSQFEQYAKQRKSQGETSILNALAAQFAGERFAPVGAAYLKKAAAANEPLKIGNNVITSDGQFLRDPFKPQEDQVKLLLARADKLEEMARRAESDGERFRLTADRNETLAQLGQLNADMRQQGLGLQQQMIDLRRDALEQKRVGQGPTYQHLGMYQLQDGSIVNPVFDKRSGQILVRTPQGMAPLPAGARQLSSQQAGPMPPAQPVAAEGEQPQPRLITPEIDPTEALGLSGVWQSGINAVTDAFNAGNANDPNRMATARMGALATQTKTALQVPIPGRPSNYLLQELERLNIRPNQLFTGQAGAQNRAQALIGVIDGGLSDLSQVLNNPASVSNEKYTEYRNSYAQLSQLKAEYQSMLRKLQEANPSSRSANAPNVDSVLQKYPPRAR
jgi:hypothetical protein